MARTRVSKAGPRAGLGQPPARPKGKTRPAKAEATRGGGKQRSDSQSAAARLGELKRRLREMASLSAPAAPDADRAPAAARVKSQAAGRAKTAKAATPKGEARRRSANRRSDAAGLAELKRRLSEISDLGFAGAVLNWDQATYMPKGGAAGRARLAATLDRLAHERFTDPALGKLLDGLANYAAAAPDDSDDARLVRVVRRDYDKAIRVPADFVARQSEASSAAYDAWTRARPANDFAAMRPFLEKALDLSRRYAEYLGSYDHIADPLIDGPDRMTVAGVRSLFEELRGELVPIVSAIAGQAPADDSCLRGHFPEQPQLEFGLQVIKRFGYDLERGRLDKTHHPFCTKFSAGDVRVTTRVKENDLSEALFSTLHEAGHALYEQGVSAALEGTGLDWGASAGVHESQSRLWENVVGRSRGFWEHFYPLLSDTFPEHFKKVPLEDFYRAVNKVERSLIRTDADEVTYNLHVMLRFDLELDLLEGRLKVKDLPEAWRARFEEDFGLTPPNDRDGCLQDVHWCSRIGGAFQGYTIGNILSAQFYAAAVDDHPEIPRAMTNGEFGVLHGWLRQHLYRHGRKFEPNAVVQRATGSPMTIKPYMAYLRAKYGELYRLPPATYGVSAPGARLQPEPTGKKP